MGYLLHHRSVQAGEGLHALVQGFGEVELAAHSTLGDSCNLFFAACVGCQHFNDLVLDKGGVYVEADEALRPAGQTRTLNGDVHAHFRGEGRQRLAQRHAATGCRVRDGQVKLQAGDRVVRDAGDRVDIRTVVRQGLADAGDVRGRQRAAQHHHHVRGVRTGTGKIVVSLDADAHAVGSQSFFKSLAERL